MLVIFSIIVGFIISASIARFASFFLCRGMYRANRMMKLHMLEEEFQKDINKS